MTVQGDVDDWITSALIISSTIEGCAVGPPSYGSVVVKIDCEGYQVAVTEVGQVLLKHVCIMTG